MNKMWNISKWFKYFNNPNAKKEKSQYDFGNKDKYIRPCLSHKK